MVTTTDPTSVSATRLGVPGTTAAVSATTTVNGLAAASGRDIFSWINAVVSRISEAISNLVTFVQTSALDVRRILFNRPPTVAPVQTTGQTVGPINGSINAVDPEGDPITYTVTQKPSHGTVTVDANGDYTYVPGDGFTGADTFTVAAQDGGLHVNLSNPFGGFGTDVMVSVTQNGGAPRVGFTFVFGEGAQNWTSEARAAFQRTAILLSSYLVVPQPVTVTYTAIGDDSPDKLRFRATAFSPLISDDPGFNDNIVQHTILTGVDTNGPQTDGKITFYFNTRNLWAYGDTSLPVFPWEVDFHSVALHELVHTSGFDSWLDQAGNNTGATWTIYDKFIVTADGSHPIDPDTYLWNSAYDASLAGAGGLYFGGPNARAAYGGKPVPLYTPNPWDYGTSVVHLDDATFFGANQMSMGAYTGAKVRQLSAVELGILADMGYNVVKPQQSMAIVIGLLFLRRRRIDRRGDNHHRQSPAAVQV